MKRVVAAIVAFLLTAYFLNGTFITLFVMRPYGRERLWYYYIVAIVLGYIGCKKLIKVQKGLKWRIFWSCALITFLLAPVPFPYLVLPSALSIFMALGAGATTGPLSESLLYSALVLVWNVIVAVTLFGVARTFQSEIEKI